ncbi:MAG: HIT family protein [Patescibacteria group bacterium]
MRDENCVFCKIIAGEIASTPVYEDEAVFAFLDINPNNPGHTLVVPKNHARNIFDIEESDMKELSARVKKIAKAVKEGVSADGINIAMNNEPAAGQLVFHAHIHVIPRFSNDGYKHWPQKSYKEGEAEIVAEKIKSHL